jgi:HAE1 family hydrophobic/amphiphilic exporter-1
MSKFFINRPIVAMVIAILTVIVGAVAVVGLPVAQLPQIAPPEVQVTATYVGADAQTIEQSVATPIEQQMSGVDNMNYMYSLNATANGQMRLIVDFDVATDPNTDLILAQSRETQAASQLPVDVTNFGVTVQKSSRFLARVNMRCACGLSRTNWRSCRSRCRKSSPRSRLRTP